MKTLFEVTSARPNKEKSGDDDSVGLSIHLKGVADEEFITRFAFGNHNGVSPEALKGVLTNCFWTKDTPNFNGVKNIDATGSKITADVTIGKISLSEASINKMKFSPAGEPGRFNCQFQVYKSDFKDDDLVEASHYICDGMIECSVHVLQTDLTE